MHPLYSIITVTYNASQTIPATIRSIASQTCRLFEWIVVDGASTDDTVRLVEQAGISGLRLVSEPDEGLYDAMNKGLGMAHGDYVIFLNAGDAFHSPDTLQAVADEIMDNDYPGIVYGQTDIVDASGHKISERHLTAPTRLTVDSFRDGMVVCHQAFIVLRKLTTAYNRRYRFSADFEWCLLCLQRSNRNLYIDSVLIDYLSEGMTTRNRRESLKERFAIMSHYFGFWPTLLRHFGFAARALRRKLKA
ncbi:MAG: glycosyltransferase [Duncaniella sp.]|nr:glycosyltransferase [Duncaniella sp.]